MHEGWENPLQPLEIMLQNRAILSSECMSHINHRMTVSPEQTYRMLSLLSPWCRGKPIHPVGYTAGPRSAVHYQRMWDLCKLPDLHGLKLGLYKKKAHFFHANWHLVSRLNFELLSVFVHFRHKPNCMFWHKMQASILGSNVQHWQWHRL